MHVLEGKVEPVTDASVNQEFLDSVLEDLASVRWQILLDCKAAGMTPEEAIEYSDAVLTYLALSVSNFANRSSQLVTWENQHEKPRYTFSLHALPMTWDFTEVNPFGRLGIMRCIEQVAAVLEKLPAGPPATVRDADAASAVKRRKPMTDDR